MSNGAAIRRMRLLVTCVAVGWGLLAAPPEPRAQSFDGITIIELKDPVGRKALGSGRGDYIVTFVSGVGTYAALLSAQQDRGCVAWARQGSYTGRSISFGLAAHEYEARTAHPPVCLPFTLRFEDASTVRVSAKNDVRTSNIPGRPTAQMSYSRKRTVIDHVPLRAIDWGHASFARHHLRNVRLGPILPGNGIEYDVDPLRRSTLGMSKAFRASAGLKDSHGTEFTIPGRAAAKENTGWPWDVAYEISHGQYLKRGSTTTAFVDAVIGLYGPPGIRPTHGGNWLWLYDLDGNALGELDARPGNCLQTREFWDRGALTSGNGDIGPWGCSLIMMLNYGSHSGMVSSYRFEVVSGYAKAMNHFLWRIEQLKETREELQMIERSEPKL